MLRQNLAGVRGEASRLTHASSVLSSGMTVIGRTIRDGLLVAASGRDLRSKLRLAFDQVLYRFLKIAWLPPRLRRARFRDGAEISYRLRRGDIMAIREIWADEIYRLPFGLAPRHVIDLGANIGAASLWFLQRFSCETIVAVEPDVENVALLRRNVARTGGVVQVIEAAVGPRDGVARFERGTEPNLGRVGASGPEVRMVSVATLLDLLPEGARAGLVKIDIEGGEEALLSGPLGWLDRVDAIIIEFHPTVTCQRDLIARVERRGFRFVPGGSLEGYDYPVFVRPGLVPRVTRSLPVA
jgi:FkbM family methyltransferase